jgi:uncharacterized tellurite resistance protein B-like protein
MESEMNFNEKTGLFYLNKNRSLFADLSSEERSWVAKLIVGTIISDNLVQKEELIYIAKAIDFLENEKEKLALVEMVRSKSIPELVKLNVEDREVAVDILFGAAHLILADTKVKPGEMAFFKRASSKLGFGREYIEDVIKWTIVFQKIKRREKELRSLGLD